MTTVGKNVIKKTLEDDVTSRTEACRKVADRVLSKGLTMEDVCKSYAKELKTKDETVRYRAIRALNDIFAQIPEGATTATTAANKPVLEASAKTLTRHYIAKLEDELCYPEVVRGMRVLVEAAGRAAFGEPADAGAITLAVISGASPVTLSSESKYDALRTALLGIELSDYTPQEAVAVLMSVRGLFVGERNTRVLREAFDIFARLLRVADPSSLQSVAQSVFDSFASYFPVLFVPSGSPVAKEALVTALRSCFAATPALAPLSIPFLVDKTSSSIATARTDAFLTLAGCVEGFGRAAMPADFLDKMTMSLRCNAFIVPADEAIDAVLRCVTAIRAAYDGTPEGAKFVADFMKMAYVGLSLCEVSKSGGSGADTSEEGEEGFNEDVANCGAKYLSRIIRYEGCADALLAQIVSTLCDGNLCDDKNPARHVIAVARADLAGAFGTLPKSALVTDSAVTLYAAASRDLAAVRAASSSTSSSSAISQHAGEVVAAVGRCLGALAACAFEQCADAAAKSAVELAHVAAGAEDEAVAAAAVEGLGAVGAALPGAVAGTPLAVLLSDATVPTATVALAPALARCNEALVEPVAEKLAACLGRADVDAARKVALVSALGASFRGVADHLQKRLSGALSAFGLDVAKRIIADAPTTPAVESAERVALSRIAESVDDPEQLALARALAATSATAATPRTLSLLYTVSAALSRASAAAAFGELVPVLALNNNGENNENLRGCALGSLLNKCVPEDPAQRKVYDEAVNATIAGKSPEALAWVVRGLVQRSHPSAGAALAAMVALCVSGAEAGACFHIVADKECPGDEGLTERCGAVLRDNYAEKVFNDTLSPLLALHAKESECAGPVLAIAAVLANAPTALLTQHAARCVPVVVRSLDFVGASPAGVRIIATLNTLLQAIPRSFAQNVERLVSRLCTLAVKAELARCRAEALAALITIRTVFSESDVVPYQDLVIAKIKPALDDNKRPVRTVAVACINAWYVL